MCTRFVDGVDVGVLERVGRPKARVLVGPHTILACATPAQRAQNMLKYSLELVFESLTIPGGLDKQPLYSSNIDDLLKHDSFLVTSRQYRLGTREGASISHENSSSEMILKCFLHSVHRTIDWY